MRLHPLLLKRSILTSAIFFGMLSSTIATAQIFTGAGADPAVAMPNITTAPDPVITPVRAPAVETMRFLPSTPDGLRLTGEIGNLRWPVYLTMAQARATTRFRVGYVSAVSILPDVSFIEAKINDQTIGTDVIDSANGLRTVEFAIPADRLQPGYNAISLSVQQRHRVDCTVPATYELWTKIDPSATGLVMGAEMGGVTNIQDIPALLPKPDGTMPIHILLSGKTNPTHLQRLIHATQEIALIGHALQPVVDFDPSPDEPYGLDLALGTRAALAGNPLLADVAAVAGPQAMILPAQAGGHPTLVVTGSSDEEVDQAIASLGTERKPRGTPAGLEAISLYPALTTSGAMSLRLRDLGIHSQDFDGRFFRTSVNINLPADFLASDYGRGTFDLAGGYAAGLSRESQVRIDVNGKSAGTIKLPDTSGDVFQHNALFLPLSLMQPGLNRVEIMAETPRPEDAACARSEHRRFLLLDGSTLTLPMLAHVERLPDLAMTAAGGLPYLNGTAHLVVPKPDRETMSAALSLTARAAVAAGQVIPFHFSTSVGTDDDGSTLIVSPARLLDPGLMASVGLDPAAVETAWHDLAIPQPHGADTRSGLSARWWTESTDGPPACALPAQALDRARQSAVPTSGSLPVASINGGDLLMAWTGEDPTLPGWPARMTASLADAAGWIEAFAKRALPLRDPPADATVIHASLVLAQGMSPGSYKNITTIVTAPNASMLRASMPCLFDPQIWPKIRGRLATLDAGSGTVTTTQATSFHYVAGRQSSLANSRLVIAGWFSLNPLAFAGMALLTALCLSGTTLWFVKNVGRRPE